MLEKNELRQILITNFDYKENHVDGVVEKLLAVDPLIYKAFENWLLDKVYLETPDYHGYNPKNLSETYPLKPPAVFMLLDWIQRDPKEALTALVYQYGKLPGGTSFPE